MGAVLMRRVSGGFVPFTNDSEKAVASIPIGGVCNVSIERPRNPFLLKKYWSMLKLFTANTDFGFTPKQVHTLLKIELDVGESFFFGGKKYMDIGSISFKSMSEDEFNVFFTNAKDILLRILPITEKELFDEISNY